MPFITIHTSSQNQNGLLKPILNDIREFTAKELSCGSRTLNQNEISVKVISSDLNQTIGEIEIVIIAYSYGERVKNQDKICLNFKNFFEKKCKPYNAYVWLQLSELGHSD